MIFQRAREKSEEGVPVIVFFDEMDSLFRTRGTGISSDIESTIVPQLLAEIDGVESLKNVIVIGASNREDLIDPAILRPGRLDVKIKIERPDEESATQDLRPVPHSPTCRSPTTRRRATASRSRPSSTMIDDAVARMYSVDDDNRFLEVTYQNGDKEVLYFKDFSSGAMIENIVRRAKKLSIKRQIDGGDKGISTQDLLDSIRQEFREHEDLPNTTNPDDWAKISGKKGERIVFVRTLLVRGRRGARRSADRARHHRPVPVSRYPAADTAPLKGPDVGRERTSPSRLTRWPIPKVCGIETEYGVVLRGAADPNPVLASSMLINGYVEATAGRLGLRGRVTRAATPAGSPVKARCRRRSRPTSSTPCSPTARATTSTTRTPSTPLPSARTRSSSSAPTRRGSGSSPVRCSPPAA